MALEVIGSGLSRTGTMSLKTALEILGFKPCYHGSESVKRISHIDAFYGLACQGKPIDWQMIFRNYKATVDAPACLHYQALMQVYPEAKVIHTIRDPDKWYDSSYENIYRIADVVPGWLQKCSKTFRHVIAIMNSYWVGFFDGRFEDREYAINKFNEYNLEVQQNVPAERLLIYEVKQGWGPLCTFLNVPVPAVPFPHKNDAKTLQRQLKLLSFFYRILPIIPVALLLIIIYVIIGA